MVRISHRCLIVLVAALVCLPGTPSASEAPDSGIGQLIERLGLRSADEPVRERPGWKKPKTVVVRGDAGHVATLEPFAPGVELVAAPTLDDAVSAAATADAVIGFCDESLLAAGPGIRWLQLPYAGAERCVAIPAIAERNILVTNAQRVYGPEIAEHVLAMMLSLTRGLHRYAEAQARGVWERGLVPEELLWELEGKTLLVVGLGGIGTEVARLGHAMGMRVTATRNSSRSGPEFVAYVGLADELDKLTAEADVVVNATPLTPATRGLFDKAFFANMKDTAYFINVGRGASVVTADLISALNDGGIAGAGLDVTDPEPLPEGHPLWDAANVIITPHISAGSDLRSARLWRVISENLRRYTAGEPMLSVVDVSRGY